MLSMDGGFFVQIPNGSKRILHPAPTVRERWRPPAPGYCITCRFQNGTSAAGLCLIPNHRLIRATVSDTPNRQRPHRSRTVGAG